MTDFNFRDFSIFDELSDNLGRKASSEKSRFGVTVPSFLLHLVLGFSDALFLPVSFPCVLSPSCFHLSPPTFIYLAALLLLHSPPPRPHQFPRPLILMCVLSVSVPYSTSFSSLSHQFFCLTVLHISLVLYFTQS